MLTPLKVRLSELSKGLFAGDSPSCLAQLPSHGLAPGGVLVEPYRIWRCFGAGNAMSAGRVSPGVLPMLPSIAFSALMCVCTQEHPAPKGMMLELLWGVWLGLVLSCAVQVPVVDATPKPPPTALRQWRSRQLQQLWLEARGRDLSSPMLGNGRDLTLFLSTSEAWRHTGAGGVHCGPG